MKPINWIILQSKDRGTDYGIGTFIKQLAPALAANRQIGVYVVETGIPGKKEFSVQSGNGVTWLRFPEYSHLKELDTEANHRKNARALARILKTVIPARETNVIHINYIFQFYFGEALKNIFNGQLIYTQHLFIPIGKQPAGQVNLEEKVYRLANHFVTVTNHGKAHLMEKGVEAAKVTPVYNGTLPDIFAGRTNKLNTRRKYGFGANEKLVVYSGRIDPIKGLKYLAIAFTILLKRYPDCRLVIAGDGNFSELMEHCRAISGKVSYLGFLPYADLIGLYKCADIGVIPSLEEHCSYVALEMLFSGLPVVASDIGGLREIFVHGRNALLTDVVPGSENMYGIAPDVEKFAENMYSLLVKPELRKTMSKHSLLRAKSMFTSEIMVRNYLKLIKST
ncbi:MAG: glycosyltransferase family 4 protein [Bacteroidota bacterium]